MDGRRNLIDIYYKEDQMNSFRDSLNRQLERLKTKIENHLAGGSNSGSVIKFDDKRLSSIAMKL